MKKKRGLILSAALASLALLCGCGESAGDPYITAIPYPDSYAASDAGEAGADTAAAPAAQPVQQIDLDLSAFSESMAYSSLMNMMIAPEDYIGKTICIKGMFDIAGGETRDYYLCTVFDPTGCCGSSIEFMPTAGLTYPEGLPEVLSAICVTGVFETYEEDGRMYCQLSDAEVVEVKM